MERLASYSRQYILKNEKKRFTLHIVLSIFAFVCMIVVPFLNSQLIDIMSTASSYNDLIWPIIFATSINVFSTAMSYLSSINMVFLLSHCQYSAISSTITHIQKIPLKDLQGHFDAAYLTQRITSDTNTVINFYCEHCIQKYLYAGNILVISYILLLLDSSLLMICAVFSALYGGIYFFLKTPLSQAMEQSKDTTAIFHKALFNRLKHLVPIKTGALFEEDELNTEKHFLMYQRNLLKFSMLVQTFSSLDGIISAFFQAAIFLIGGIQVIQENMTIGQYLIVNSYFSFFLKSIKYYFNYGKSYQDAHTSYFRLRNLLDIEEEPNGLSIPNKINQITLKNMTFSFRPNECSLFNQFELKLSTPGLWILKGENGSGKTTLINILIGLFSPIANTSIQVNDYLSSSDINWYALRKKRVSILSQNEDKSDLSVNEYLSFFCGSSVNSMATEIADPLLIDLFFGPCFNLSKIQNHAIINLSGGEWQRVRLFKALIKDADVYFFDEPTNNLDQESIRNLKSYITKLRKSKILLITSHDNTFDSIASKVIFLEKGGHYK